MKRLFGFSGLLAGAAIALAACGTPASGSATAATSPSATGSAAATSASPSAPAATPSATPSPQMVGTSLGARMVALGQIVVDSRGMTLYLFEADRGTASVCYGACAQNWPPLLTHGSPVALTGVNASLLGTTARTDGAAQVTYSGHPLYFFVGDHRPGDTTGQGINAFGGGWDVLSPSGTKIEGRNS
jgi:predicted lipoprotein with Yx(FWY)xxD motif